MHTQQRGSHSVPANERFALNRNSRDYEIRQATGSDLPSVIDLAVEVVLHSTSPYRSVPGEDIRRYRREDLQGLQQALLDPNFRIFVAATETELLGHVLLHCAHRDSTTGVGQAWIYDLSVAPRHWGNGIGKALLRAAEESAAASGIRAIGLGVTLSNQRALRFYREQGYLDERIQMVKLIP